MGNHVITIEQEVEHRGKWLKVYLPPHHPGGKALLLNKQGATLRQVSLNEGHNAIDISGITENPISIKIETDFQTIMKEINIRPGH